VKAAELLEKRRQNWRELEQLCDQLQTERMARLGPQVLTRFAALYRAACADLALADAYHLPPNTVQYLHRLVGQAHARLYRTSRFDMAAWGQMLLVEAPRRIFRDPCVQVAFCAFWGVFLLSALLAYSKTIWPDYAEKILGNNQIEQLEQNFSEEIAGRDPNANFAMAGFYIQHNTGIGLQCFAGGLLVIPGIYITIYNAVQLGASFGYMARPDIPPGANFFHFVTAHGPFELTAIVLSAASGLRLGLSWIYTRGFSRTASLRRTALEAMPLMGAAMVMFFLAAMIEGFLSPSAAPYALKAVVAVTSSAALMFYFVVLGTSRKSIFYAA